MLDTAVLPPHDPTAPKSWWQSKTTWLGVALTLVGISTYFTDPLHTPTLTVASISEAIGGVAAIVLRVWFTNSAIAGTQAAAQAETVKQDIALHAVVTTAPPAAPAPIQPSVEDVARYIVDMKRERDRMTEVLNQAAAMASSPPVVPPAPAPA